LKYNGLAIINVVQINTAIANAKAKWSAQENSFTNLSISKLKLLLGFSPKPGERSLQEMEKISEENLNAFRNKGIAVASYPGSYDLRNVSGRNFITGIRDQSFCGSCVAFGVAATAEGTLRRQRDDASLYVDYSEAQLFYCYASTDGQNCSSGWWPTNALDHFKTGGVVDESCFPYVAGDQSCKLCTNSQSLLTRISDWHVITSTDQMKTWISTKGPLCACFSVYEDFYAYRNGIYRHVTGSIVDGHCVSVIGYNDTDQYWICKNSWGSSWGEGGFFRIAYGNVGIDSFMYAVDGVEYKDRTPGIAVVTNGLNGLEAFVKWSDNALYHIWQTGPAGNWSGWDPLGGILTSDPVAVTNDDGAIEVFVRGTDNGLYHIWQVAPHGNWSGWSPLGGILTSNIAVAKNGYRGLEVFVRGTDNGLYHIWQNRQHGNWSGWDPLGGVIT